MHFRHTVHVLMYSTIQYALYTYCTQHALYTYYSTVREQYVQYRTVYKNSYRQASLHPQELIDKVSNDRFATLSTHVSKVRLFQSCRTFTISQKLCYFESNCSMFLHSGPGNEGPRTCIPSEPISDSSLQGMPKKFFYST